MVTSPARSLITAKAVTEPGVTPSFSISSSAEQKDSRPLAPIVSMQALEIDAGVLAGGDQEEPALLVLQEQILGMQAGHRLAQRARIPRP